MLSSCEISMQFFIHVQCLVGADFVTCPAANPYALNNGRSCCSVPVRTLECPALQTDRQNSRLEFEDTDTCCLFINRIPCDGMICLNGNYGMIVGKQTYCYLLFEWDKRIQTEKFESKKGHGTFFFFLPLMKL